MENKFMSIQHIDKISICFIDGKFSSIKKYGQVVYIIHVQVVYICHIEICMSYDTEKVHNEPIDMNYLGKRYMILH